MIIAADRVITGDGSTVLENAAVAVEGKKILALGTAEELTERFPGQELVTLDGCTLLPGMVDMHTHIAYGGGESPDGTDENKLIKTLFAGRRMENTLKAGVTTIRDVASPDGIVPALKKAAAAGYIRSPRILTSLRGLCITGGHGWNMTASVYEVDGVEEVRRAVRLNIRNGADCIKLLDSEGYRGEEFNQEELNAAVAEAHRFGVRVAAHAGYDPSMEMCINAGCDSIEHGTHLTVEQALRMKENDQTWVPTIYVFNYVYDQVKAKQGGSMEAHADYLEDSVSAYRDNFKKLYDTGVRVATGTDTDCCDHPQASPVALECRYMVDCGITPLQAIGAATWNGALALGLGDKLGLLKEGYLADLVAVRGDAAQDIDSLTRVVSVWQEGTCVYESESAHLRK